MSQRPIYGGEQDTYGRSADLWRGIPFEDIISYKDRNVGWGFWDDFFEFHANSLDGPYGILEGGGCSVEQVASTGNSSTTAMGQVKMAIDGNAENDEVALVYGRGLDAMFYFNSDLAFECRIMVSATTAAKYSLLVGLGEVGALTTDLMFADDTQALYDANWVAFQRLQAESTAVDAMFKADGQTAQDGAAVTGQDTVATLTAATFIKLGFRYQHVPRQLRWYVDGVEVEAARVGASALDAATFPDDVYLTACIGAKDAAGDTAVNVYVDWWGGAQIAG